MSLSLMNTKEVAEYLDIHEKQVYALIKAGRLPATRVTGKWIFPKKMVDDWIEGQAKNTLGDAKQKSSRIEGALLAAGSNDPALDLLLTSMQSSHPEFFIFTATMGSIAGLKALGQGYTDVAWSHLFDPQTGNYNTPESLAPYLNRIKAVVVHLFNRDIGWLVPPGNPLDIEGFDDIPAKKPKIVNRQPGAGTRVYLDYRLKKAGIAPETIPGYDDVVFTHMDAGLAVLTGNADTALASSAVA
jgi:excisionase family DNA binding protein